MGNIVWSTLPDHQNAGDFGHKIVKTYFGVQINVTDRSGRCPECILRTVRLKTKFITFFKFCVDILSKRVQQILCILRSRRIRLWNVRVFETSTFETILQTSTDLHFTSFQWIYMIILLMRGTCVLYSPKYKPLSTNTVFLSQYFSILKNIYFSEIVTPLRQNLQRSLCLKMISHVWASQTYLGEWRTPVPFI